jgi:16S rRNA (cytosine967-C5)-methyltransferase
MSGQKVIEEQQDWIHAVDLLSQWEKGTQHADDLLEALDPGRLRWLVMEVFRQWLVVEGVLDPLFKRPPRPKVRQLLRLALAECLNRPAESHPKIVHNAGEVARSMKLSKGERGFLNGVLRNCLRKGLPGADNLPATHPEWMVARWRAQFGEEGLQQLLQWNQSKGEVLIQAARCPSYADVTEWEGYFRIRPSMFREAVPDLQGGVVYAQDPFARIPVDLLDPQPGERIFDFCAAPGGKTRLMVNAMTGKGSIVAVDQPGKRLKRLEENVVLMPGKMVGVVGNSLQSLTPEILGEPADGILIDVPCSNTGVIRKRPDVKLRLQAADILRQAEQQLELLRLAADWVRPGGRLVYSTCSLEAEENQKVVDAFLESAPDWCLGKTVLSLPWECHHDGGGAFLLTKK